MPLPFGHSLMGYAWHDALEPETRFGFWKTLLLFMVVANLPDIDFLPGFLLGKPNLYHHHYLSHSLGFAVVVGAALGGFFARRTHRSFWYFFAVFTCVCYSHVILDYFTADTSQPVGVPMFWPFSTAFFYAPVPIFLDVHKTGDSATFFQSLFVWHNFWVAAWEVALFAPVLAVIKLVKNRKRVLVRLANEQSY